MVENIVKVALWSGFRSNIESLIFYVSMSINLFIYTIAFLMFMSSFQDEFNYSVLISIQLSKLFFNLKILQPSSFFSFPNHRTVTYVI